MCYGVAAAGTITFEAWGACSVLESLSGVVPEGAGGFRSMMEPAEAARYDAYWQRYAPEQVAPGTGRLDFTRVSGRTGAVENSRVIYDQFGRQQYRIDFTDHLRPEAHSSPHLHEYQYGPGYYPYREILHNLNGQ